MKPGARAQVVQPVIAGQIADKRYNPEHDSIEYLLVYTDGAGDVQYRWFLEKDLKEEA